MRSLKKTTAAVLTAVSVTGLVGTSAVTISLVTAPGASASAKVFRGSERPEPGFGNKLPRIHNPYAITRISSKPATDRPHIQSSAS